MPKIRRMPSSSAAVEPAGAGSLAGPRPGPRWSLKLGLALAFLLFLGLAARFWFVCDDAFISFRYARHLVEGHGLVYNTSESPPVEGYTNFAWVLWTALAEFAGAPPGVFANVTSLACAILLLALVTRTARRELRLDDGRTVLVCAFLACVPGFVVWSTSGLETLPFTLFAFLAFERMRAARGVQAGACALLAALLRADGAALAFVALVTAAPAGYRALGPARARQLGIAVLILAAGVGLHLAWRRSYYEDWLPNTAYAKGGLTSLRLERGLKYLVANVLTVPTLALVPLAAAFWGARDARLLRVQSALLTGCVYGYAALVGGDWMSMGRFLVPALPFVTLSFAAWIARLARPSAALLGPACLVLQVLPLFDLHVVPFSIRERFHFRWNDREVLSEYQRWTRTEQLPKRTLLARELAKHTCAADSMPSIAIGILGYYTEIQILDQCGLVSREVARRPTAPVRASPGHDKFVPPQFFLPVRPTIARCWISPLDAPLGATLQDEWVQSVEKGELVLESHPIEEPGEGGEAQALRILRIPADSPLLPP